MVGNNSTSNYLHRLILIGVTLPRAPFAARRKTTPRQREVCEDIGKDCDPVIGLVFSLCS
jgi:hypothetical protein